MNAGTSQFRLNFNNLCTLKPLFIMRTATACNSMFCFVLFSYFAALQRLMDVLKTLHRAPTFADQRFRGYLGDVSGLVAIGSGAHVHRVVDGFHLAHTDHPLAQVFSCFLQHTDSLLFGLAKNLQSHSSYQLCRRSLRTTQSSELPSFVQTVPSEILPFGERPQHIFCQF